jgi:hypothetical protein
MSKDSLADQTNNATEEDSCTDKESRSGRTRLAGSGWWSVRSAGADLFKRLASDSTGTLLRLGFGTESALGGSFISRSKSVLLQLIEQCLVTDAKVFGSLSLVATICFQDRGDLLPLGKRLRTLGHVRQSTFHVELVQ